MFMMSSFFLRVCAAGCAGLVERGVEFIAHRFPDRATFCQATSRGFDSGTE